MSVKAISKALIQGSIKAFPSKSEMQRVVLGAALSNGTSTIQNPSLCDDGIQALKVAELLGSKVSQFDTEIKIHGAPNFNNLKGEIPCKESGLLSRMMSSISALSPNEVTISGEGTLLSRPFGTFVSALKSLGCELWSSDGKLPLKIRGPLKGGEIEIDGGLTSQFLSGLLFALPLVSENSIVRVRSLISRPYVNLTLSVLERFGIKITTLNDEFHIRGSQEYTPNNFTIEGDWSGAAFFLVGAALGGSVSVSGLSLDSLQGDKSILYAIREAGAVAETSDKIVRVESRPLKAFRFDAADSPDLIPALVALAVGCKGESVIAGAGRLIFKESNRAASLLSEFSSMGANIVWDGNLLRVTGGELQGGKVKSHGDHRISMACAIAGLISNNGVTIEGADAVSKSYPNFFNMLSTVTT